MALAAILPFIGMGLTALSGALPDNQKEVDRGTSLPVGNWQRAGEANNLYAGFDYMPNKQMVSSPSIGKWLTGTTGSLLQYKIPGLDDETKKTTNGSDSSLYEGIDPEIDAGDYDKYI